MLTDKTIEKACMKRIRTKIADGQKRYEEQKKQAEERQRKEKQDTIERHQLELERMHGEHWDEICDIEEKIVKEIIP